MDKYTFIAKLTHDSENGYTIEFPDLPGCITEGDNLEECNRNAKEALSLHLFGMEEDHDDIPNPIGPEEIEVEKGQLLMPVTVYMKNVRDDMRNKVVSKTVTLPRWLRDEGEKQKLNFSGILQRALKNELGIEK